MSWTRRRLIAVSLAVPVAAQAQVKATRPIRIGIIGSGRIGSAAGELWIKAGHEVMFSSRHPEELRPMAARLGPRARVGTVAEAAAFGPVVFLAVPYSALPAIGQEHGATLKGKVVIDASNPYPARDGPVAQEALDRGVGPTSTKYLLGVRYVRAFNPVSYALLKSEAHRPEPKVGIPVFGDDKGAVDLATALVREAGFEPVTAPLNKAMAFAPDTPLYGRAHSGPTVRKYLNAWKR